MYINYFLLNLINDKQLLYNLIYNLNLIKLEKLKTLEVYINTHLAIKFIRYFKFIINNLILYIKKKIKISFLY